MIKKRTLGLGTALALTLTVAAQAPAWAQDPAAGETVFRQCMACHTLQEGQNRVGPSLHGVFGRTSGAVEGFNYSDAMKNAGIVWDAETISAYLANPRDYIPGNRMTFAGIPDEQRRVDLIAYLEQATQ